MSLPGVGSALVLSTGRQRCLGNKFLMHLSRQYHDMPPSGSESSIYPLPLQQPVFTSPGFSQVGTSALATMALSSFPTFSPTMVAPQWVMNPMTYPMGLSSTLVYSHPPLWCILPLQWPWLLSPPTTTTRVIPLPILFEHSFCALFQEFCNASTSCPLSSSSALPCSSSSGGRRFLSFGGSLLMSYSPYSFLKCIPEILKVPPILEAPPSSSLQELVAILCSTDFFKDLCQLVRRCFSIRGSVESSRNLPLPLCGANVSQSVCRCRFVSDRLIPPQFMDTIEFDAPLSVVAASPPSSVVIKRKRKTKFLASCSCNSVVTGMETLTSSGASTPVIAQVGVATMSLDASTSTATAGKSTPASSGASANTTSTTASTARGSTILQPSPYPSQADLVGRASSLQESCNREARSGHSAYAAKVPES